MYVCVFQHIHTYLYLLFLLFFFNFNVFLIICKKYLLFTGKCSNNLFKLSYPSPQNHCEGVNTSLFKFLVHQMIMCKSCLYVSLMHKGAHLRNVGRVDAFYSCSNCPLVCKLETCNMFGISVKQLQSF